jgi:hypothetical protein
MPARPSLCVMSLLLAGALGGAQAHALEPGLPPLPTLDEALGLVAPDPSRQAPTAPAQPDITRQRIDDLLNPKSQEQGGDEFAQAVVLMSQSASRLTSPADTGDATQRLQQDAIRKLEQLIAKAGKQSSSQSKKDSQNQPEPQDGQQQQQPSQASAGEQQTQVSRSTQSGETDGPELSGQRLRPALEAARAAWGNLPERVRQSLLQGAGDRFSRDYQRLTEEYYKRLGEQVD